MTVTHLAMVIDEQPNYLGWLTDSGVAVRTDVKGHYHHGDFAFISINDYGKGSYYGLIRGFVREDLSDDLKLVRREDCPS